MKVLELFSGTGSVGKVCKELEWEVISLDFLSKWKPDIVADILEWDYKVYPPNTFDIVWGSPPCAEYSSVKNSWIGRELIDGKTGERYIYTREIQEEKMKQSDKLVKKVLEIIDYFKPKICKWDCCNLIEGKKKHKADVSTSISSPELRYRIPPQLIRDLFANY